MEENKMLGIAWGAPIAMLLGGLAVGGISSPGGADSEAVAVASANDSFAAQVSAEVEEPAEQGMDPEVEKILYPYRDKSKTEPAPVEVAASETGSVSPVVEPIEPVPVPSDPIESVGDEAEEVQLVSNLEDVNESIEADSIEADSTEAASIEVDLIEVDPVAVDPVAVDPVAVDPVAVDPVAAAEPSPIEPVPAAPTEATVATTDALEPMVTPALEVVPESEEMLSIDPAPAVPPAPIGELASAAEPAQADPPETAEPIVEDLVSNDPAPAIAPEPTSVAVADPAPEVTTDVATEDFADPAPEADAVAVADPVAAEPPASPKPSAAGPKPLAVNDPLPQVTPVPTVASATPGGKPFLGVGIRDSSGTVITTLYSGSTAVKLGLRLGDELKSLNGATVADISSLRGVLGRLAVGDQTTVVVQREGQLLELGPLGLGTR